MGGCLRSVDYGIVRFSGSFLFFFCVKYRIWNQSSFVSCSSGKISSAAPTREVNNETTMQQQQPCVTLDLLRFRR